MKWIALTACILVFLTCALGVFACVLASDLQQEVGEREERFARKLAAGMVASLLAGWYVITRW